MVIKYFRRIARGGAALMAATLGFSLLGVTAAPSPASASVNQNCGKITCTLYLDKQDTRALNSLSNNIWIGFGAAVAAGAVCAVVVPPAALAAGFACGVVVAAGDVVIKSQTTKAVKLDGCLTIKYGVGSRGAGATLGAVGSDSPYCKDGVPLFLDGTLIKQASAPQVFVVYGGAKFLITDPEAFAALGFSWSAIKTIPDKKFYSVPALPKYGTILRERAVSLPTVYRIENGRKRAVSLSEYQKNGYGKFLRTVDNGQLINIPN